MPSKTLNYDLVNAQPVVLRPFSTIEFWMVGCGGTGSFLVRLLCRLMQSLIQQGKECKLVLIDPDTVEVKNLTRQCFCTAEVGLNKAHALAARYSTAWNLPIQACAEAFDPTTLSRHYNKLIILFGCVDNAQARTYLAKALEFNHSQSPRIWWIDGGNGDRFGQVLVGSSLDPRPETYSASELGWIWLPAPSVQAPDLLIAKPEEVTTVPLSCAEQTLLNIQGLMVNPQVAILMADVAQDLLKGTLKRFAVLFDQTTGTMQSRYTTQEAIRAALNRCNRTET